MPVFSFEIAQEGKPPFLAQDQSLADISAAWCQVEALAVMAKDSRGSSIRVRNAEGHIIIFTGIATALATIEKCRRPDCPLGNVKGSEKAAYRSRLLPVTVSEH
ncbi:hypothetical protein [uncultured Rhodoblastus sp.]|uniref:hypothetical protein n=1 Tax=uncultured Rhodoblastus sp. TaxID=543037 RepID=UPI0025E9CDBE|nr:hypothetical protein [uncultured Rhodoblastus sp.]